MTMKARFIVEVELKDEPEHGTRIRSYVKDAVQSWGGQFHPDDPLFSYNIKRVRVWHEKEHCSVAQRQSSRLLTDRS